MSVHLRLAGYRRSRASCRPGGLPIFSFVKDVVLPAPVWTRLTWAWVAFFIFMGVLNWYVAFHFSLDTWVTFKVWGGTGLFLAFALMQGFWLSRHVKEETA